jgi:hypothetical protein
MDKVLKYLMENFPDNEPIFIKELEIESMPKTTLRVKIKELTDAGLLVRYSTGVYYLYTPNTDGVSHDISAEEIITKKYIKKNGVTTGYNSFNAFITQNREKSTFYIVSNAATCDHRVIKMDNFVIDIKKPKTVINDSNFRVLQFLDMINELKNDDIKSNSHLKNDVRAYLKNMGISPLDLRDFVKYYPDKIYKSLFELDLISFTEF